MERGEGGSRSCKKQGLDVGNSGGMAQYGTGLQDWSVRNVLEIVGVASPHPSQGEVGSGWGYEVSPRLPPTSRHWLCSEVH